jgi:hypothetical protein
VRRAFLDLSGGERRGVIAVHGRPERLLIERDEDPPAGRLGARLAARVRRVEPASRLAFLDIGLKAHAVTSLGPGLTEGAAVEVEVTAEPRRGKGAAVRVLGPTTGEAPRVLATGPTLEQRLRVLALDGPAAGGAAARDAADLATEAALAFEHPLPGGGLLTIERTRALTAVDVDLGAGVGEAGRAARRVNLAAIDEAARLLRLKSLGGLIVIDLVGAGQQADARAAFASDNPGVSFGPISRFGLLQLAKPWRETPIDEHLLERDGRSTLLTLAASLVRALSDAGAADPGGLFEAQASPELASLAAGRVAALGPRFRVTADPGRDRGATDIRRR